MERSTFNRIVGIVKEMNSQGVSRKDIQTNLKQMGLSEDDIGDILAEAKPEVNVAEIHEEAAGAKQLLESGEHLRPAIQKLDAQAEGLERIHTHLGEVHEKQNVSAKEIAEIREELEEIRRQIEEMKPMIAAIRRLDESLIKINKRMLTRLGGQ